MTERNDIGPARGDSARTSDRAQRRWAAGRAGLLRRMGYTDVTDLGGICNYRGKVVK